MVAKPDDYTFKRQLMKGLPQEMVDSLIKNRRVTAEHTMLPRLLQEAKAMESAFQAVEQHKKERNATGYDRSGHVVVATVGHNSGKTVRFNTSHKSNKHRSSSTPSTMSTNNNGRQQGRSSSSWRRGNSPAPRSGSSRPPIRSSNGPSQRPGPSSGSSQTKIAKPSGSSSSNKVTCFTCGQEGHYATNCHTNKRKINADK